MLEIGDPRQRGQTKARTIPNVILEHQIDARAQTPPRCCGRARSAGSTATSNYADRPRQAPQPDHPAETGHSICKAVGAAPGGTNNTGSTAGPALRRGPRKGYAGSAAARPGRVDEQRKSHFHQYTIPACDLYQLTYSTNPSRHNLCGTAPSSLRRSTSATRNLGSPERDTPVKQTGT